MVYKEKMKNLFAIFTICFTVGAQAQELPKGLAPNERDVNFLQSIGVVGNPYQNKLAQATIYTTPPSFNVRTMAEWEEIEALTICLLYTSPSPRDGLLSRMPSSA